MAKESKRERFVRVAEARTNKIIEMIRLLGNCSAKGSYEYTDADIRQIFGAIDKELKAAKNRFTGDEEKEEHFKLK